MLYKISVRLADRLFNHGVIAAENKDIYVYGFQLLISFLFSTSLVLLIGAVLGKIAETIAFLIVYILLRSFSGGYHANSYAVCTIVTMSVYLIVVLMTSLVNVSLVAYLSLFLCGIILLALMAPVRHPNKKISSKDAIKYKVISLGLYSIFVCIGIYMLSENIKLGNAVFYTLCADIINLFPNCRCATKNKQLKEDKNV